MEEKCIGKAEVVSITARKTASMFHRVLRYGRAAVIQARQCAGIFCSRRFLIIRKNAFFAFPCNYAILARRKRIAIIRRPCHEKAAHRDTDIQ